MDSLFDIELPPTTSGVIAEESKILPENKLSEVLSQSEQKDVVSEGPCKEINVIETQQTGLMHNAISASFTNKSTTDTDNLLSINLTFPKATVLGKEQAKKRLQAFSLTRPACTSPVVKKLKCGNQSLGDSNEETRNKKRLNAEEKAESVIKEIEEIKNAQRADSQENEVSQFGSNVKFKEKVRGKWKSTRKYKFQEFDAIGRSENFEYPQNWQEFNLRHHTLELIKVKNMELNLQCDRKNPFDYKRHANFEVPPLPVTSYKYIDANGEEKYVPFNYIRYTHKSGVPIAYNPTLKFKQQKFFTRKHFFSIINKSHQEEIMKLLNKCSSSSDRRSDTRVSQRNWYPKTAFFNIEGKECEISEPTVGLSILKMYSDEDDSEFICKKMFEDKSYKDDKGGSLTPEQSNPCKRQRKKEKRKHGGKSDKSSEEREADSKNENNDKLCATNNLYVDETTVVSSSKDIEQHVEYMNEINANDSSNIMKTGYEIRQENGASKNHFLDSISNTKSEISKKAEDYSSQWESDEDVSSMMSSQKTETDCDRETKPNQLLSERSLEMPLTIQAFTRRSYWDELKVKELEDERKKIQEERKKLEMEKKKLLELERLYKLNLLHNDAISKSDSFSDCNQRETEMINENDLGLTIKEEKVSDEDTSSRSLNMSSLSQPPQTVSDEDSAKQMNESSEKDQSVLETEYEEFIRDISQQSNEGKEKCSKAKRRRYSSSTTSSSSSDSEASSDSITSTQKESTFDIQPKDQSLDLPEAPIPTLLNNMSMPRPVPLPTIFSLNEIIKDNDAAIIHSHIETNDSVPKQQFTFTKISLPSKKNLLEKSAFNDTEDSNHSTQENESKTKKDAKSDDSGTTKSKETERSKSSDKERKDSRKSTKRSRSRDRDFRRRKSVSPRRRRRVSPKNHKDNSKRKDYSPRRRRSLPRRSTPRKRDDTPKRNVSPRRKSSPRRRRGRDRSYSPRRGSPRSRLSPHRSYSPKRSRRDSSSPKRRSSSPSKKGSNITRKESIQVTLQRIAGMEDYSNKSPTDSPSAGFRRSLADSTISDDLLMHNNYNAASPFNCYYPSRTTESPCSPRRLSLDDRINQALGIEKDPHKGPTNQMYHDYNYGYYDQYGQYQYNEYGGSSMNYPDYDTCTSTPNKVVQVGNVLQVVPTEDSTTLMDKSLDSQNKKNNSETTPKILQVGNMLQIVPTDLPQSAPPVSTIATTTCDAATEKPTAETLMKQKIAEARAEREKRRNERERRRKEKERKRKEKERKRQMKMKKKTENMIKRALLLETEEETENAPDNEDAPNQWPPAPIIISTTLKNLGKGILMSRGFGSGDRVDDDEKKKSVKFADGIIPGEGTSPSGGEELTSPPPTQRKLPKEKRFTKTKKPKKIKIPKKKKIKVKIIRTPNISNELDGDEDDNLPPPSPPPGSPPPHVFPPRIKAHAVNNLHPSYQSGLPVIPINNNFATYRAPLATMPHPHHGHHHQHHLHGGPHAPPVHGCPPPPGPVIHHPPPGPVIHHSPSGVCHPPTVCGPPTHHHHHPSPSHPPHHHHHHGC